MGNNFISSIWDFKDVSLTETNYATHDFLRWYGKLIPQLVSRLIKLYSNENDLILANFAGSGTVLVESNIQNRSSIGVDASPLSNLLCSVKTNPHKPNHDIFLSSIEKYMNENEDKKFRMDDVDKKWYDSKTFQEIMLIKEEIDNISEENTRKYYSLALAAITRKASRVDSRCINHIVVDKNKKKINVFDSFKKKINDMDKSMEEFIKLSNDSNTSIVNGDARNLKQIDDESVDLVISHPPYLGHILYSNIFKLANKIIGHDYDDVKKEDMSTNSLSKYMESMKKVFDEMLRVLKPGKYACVIIGDNRKDGNIVPTFSHFINYAESINFNLKDIFIWVMSQKAGMSVKRRGNHLDHNYILIFQKN
jgi:hypothetical protein